MRNTFRRAARYSFLCAALTLMPLAASAADRIEGRVEAGGVPIAKAEVTLWAAGPGAPQRLVETKAE
jgi:hypothetical protein